jgi:hypothetical protein
MDSSSTYAAGFLLRLQCQKASFMPGSSSWKAHILEYDCPFNIHAGLLSSILANEMVRDETYILYFSFFQEILTMLFDSVL